MSEYRKPLIIYDTDMDTDCDDTGALAMLLNAARESRIELLGIVTDAPVSEAAPCCEAFCRYYGADVPIGAVRARRYADDPRYARYFAHRPRLRPIQYYNRPLARSVGKTDEDYPDAAAVYRRLLAEADDNSVTIACVGFMTAMAELLESGGDDISPLDGVELVRRKVCRVVSMGELPRTADRCTTFNYAMDIKGSEIFFEKCPVPVIISPDGGNVLTGAHLTASLPGTHPLRLAYENYNGPATGRSSWDLIAVLQAIYPGNPWQHAEELGTVRVSANEGSMRLDPNGPRMDQVLISDISEAQMMELLNAMLF